MKSWTWKNVLLRPGELRTFTVPKQYDIKAAGTYKVDFNVYTRDMRPLHRLSKTFIAVDEAQPPVKTAVPAAPEKSLPLAAARPPKTATTPLETDRHFGFGLYANTFNGAGGATMLLWPFRHVGMQAIYAVGVNTITEGRLLVRFPLSSGINPYVGAGYVSVSTERNVEVINIKTTFKDSGISGVAGFEVPFGKRVTGYLEVGVASIDLKKEVTDGTISGTATVDYAPVTIGIGITYNLF
ncbi:MAG TPA: outer membrane beta-barrel protein [Nitrospirota bacterium]